MQKGPQEIREMLGTEVLLDLMDQKEARQVDLTFTLLRVPVHCILT